MGGPSDTSVRVRYGEYLDQCLLCVGSTIEGDECGAPNGGSTSDAAMRSRSGWTAELLAVTAGAIMMVAGIIV